MTRVTKNTTAAVEVLTAEVRVLMVGSRQVTMSVYNQLDLVADCQIEPFGRVAPKDAQGRYVHVVGRSRVTGALVRARTPTYDGTRNDRERWIRYAAVRAVECELGLSSHERVPENLVRAEAGRLIEIEAEWSALPLIVLAGLR